jgi:hypothetical protein
MQSSEATIQLLDKNSEALSATETANFLKSFDHFA